MAVKKEILVVGAGPSGLSAALFLSGFGYHPVIIDKKNKPAEYSKALGVNPRTLEIMDQQKIAHRFLENGRKMNAVNLWKGDEFIYKNDFGKARHRYPFMLIQPQKESEEILLDELSKRKIMVNYGAELESFSRKDLKYEVKLKNKNISLPAFDYLIGADGAHSFVREQLRIKFQGFSYDAIWEIYNLELETGLNKDEGHIRLFKEGLMVMIRLSENVWRIGGNIRNLLNYLPKQSKAGDIIWESKFRIHHKIASSPGRGNAVIIGDASHLHSPMGARGMNLGIEDAFIVSKLIKEDNLKAYNSLRQPYLKRTVSRINYMTQGLAGNSFLSKTLRHRINFFRFLFPVVMPGARNFILGLNN